MQQNECNSQGRGTYWQCDYLNILSGLATTKDEKDEKMFF